MKIEAIVLFFLSVAVIFVGSAESGGFAVAEGKELYNEHCRVCHGGKNVPAISGVTDFKKRFGMLGPDRDLFTAIWDGIKGMPAFIGLLTKDEVRNIIWYLRTVD